MLPKKDLRVIFLYEFKLGRNGAEAYQNIVDAWGKGQLSNAQYDDKLRCHISKIILKKLGELKCEALPHLPYSPDLSDDKLRCHISKIILKKFGELKYELYLTFHTPLIFPLQFSICLSI
uniref:HTH_48 domain-containing protein n=1 Tax=Strongyloides papillosus TaxID=174720 RepID=A0A0N5C4U5_STREA